MKRTYFLFLVCWLLCISKVTADTKTGSWDLTKASSDWAASRNVQYFSQPYGFKAANGTLMNKSIADFSTAGITEIKVGFKCLQNGASTSKLTIYLVDTNGNALGSGVVVTPVNANASSSTTYQYATFKENLAGATGFMMKVTTFGKNILVNGAEYTVTYTTTTPTLTPSTSALSFESVENNTNKALSFNLKGANLTDAVSLTLSDNTYFSLSAASATADEVNAESGKDITVTYTPNGTVGEHTATLTLSSTGATDKTITLSGTAVAPLTHYTVNWMVNGAAYTKGEPTTDVTEGSKVKTLPTAPAAIGNKVFMGWTNAAISGTQDAAPTVLFTTAAEAPAVTANTTYYAVFANATPGSNTWKRIKNLEDITEGSYVIKNDAYVLPSTTTGSSEAPAQVSAPAITDDNITGTVDESMIWHFTTTSTANQFFIKNAAGNYLYANSANNGVRINTTPDKWTFAVNTADYFSMQEAKNNRYCATYSDGTDWRSYESATHANYRNGGKLELYKYERVYSYTDYVTTISFSAFTVSFDAGTNGTCSTSSLTEAEVWSGVTLPECKANDGYRFIGWSKEATPTAANAGKAGEIYYPAADCTLYAYYKPEYTVTIEAPEHGILAVKYGESPVTSGDKFLEGDVISITATPSEGYKFRNLQVVDGSTHTFTTSNTKEWTMTAYHTTISANFDAITYSTITKVVNGEVASTEQVENGTPISFASPEASTIPTGYAFVGWAAAEIEGTQPEAPELVNSGTATAPATYYAVLAAVTSTGDEVWEEITTTPEPGTYAILSESYFMKASISSSRFGNGTATPQISATTPATLTTAPAADCIWEISKPDEYYRIAHGSQYAGGTDTKNEGALLNNASVNLAKWTIEYSGSQFSITNYGRSLATENNTNKYLRNNYKYGWACYASSTGDAPRLFQKKNRTVLADYCTTTPDVALSVGQTGYSSLYYSNFDLVVPENTAAFTFKSVNGAVTASTVYDQGDVVPAGEAVVVYTINAVPCTLNFKKVKTATAPDAGSQLHGTDVETAITDNEACYFYGMSLNKSNDLKSVGFYWMNATGAAFTNGAHKVYLTTPKSEIDAGQQANRGFSLSQLITGVESVECHDHEPQAVYDLSGRRIRHAGKGIYIVNGKKIIK